MVFASSIALINYSVLHISDSYKEKILKNWQSASVGNSFVVTACPPDIITVCLKPRAVTFKFMTSRLSHLFHRIHYF